MNGCNTAHPDYAPRRPFYLAQDGYTMKYDAESDALTATPRYIRIVDVMSKDCQYSKHRNDIRCANCERKHKNEN